MSRLLTRSLIHQRLATVEPMSMKFDLYNFVMKKGFFSIQHEKRFFLNSSAIAVKRDFLIYLLYTTLEIELSQKYKRLAGLLSPQLPPPIT